MWQTKKTQSHDVFAKFKVTNKSLSSGSRYFRIFSVYSSQINSSLYKPGSTLAARVTIAMESRVITKIPLIKKSNIELHV